MPSLQTNVFHIYLSRGFLVRVSVPRGPERVTVASPVPRPVVVRLAVCPFGPVTVVELPPAERSVDRVVVPPFGPVVVAVTSPVPRPVTVRFAVPPFGPVTVVELPPA
jgi:hypothetical protein